MLIEETEVVFVFIFIFGSDIFLVFLEKYKSVILRKWFVLRTLYMKTCEF